MENLSIKQNVKKRDTNMELLRIMAMIMVVALHCVGRGKLLDNPNINTFFSYQFILILDESFHSQIKYNCGKQ